MEIFEHQKNNNNNKKKISQEIPGLVDFGVKLCTVRVWDGRALRGGELRLGTALLRAGSECMYTHTHTHACTYTPMCTHTHVHAVPTSPEPPGEPWHSLGTSSHHRRGRSGGQEQRLKGKNWDGPMDTGRRSLVRARFRRRGDGLRPARSKRCGSSRGPAAAGESWLPPWWGRR